MSTHRAFRLLSITLIAFLFVTALPAAAVQAKEPAQDVPGGNWTGYIERILTTSTSASGITTTATTTFYAELALQVSASGSVTGDLAPITYTTDYAITTGDGGHCDGEAAYTVSGSVSMNGAHLPVFNLNLQQVSQSWGCDNPTLEQGGMNVVNTLMLEAATYSGSKITGEEIQFDDDYFDFAVSNLLKGGASVSTSEYWELTSTSPYVEALDARYYDYFLADIPLTNTYTAIVNWNGNSAGKVVFTLDSLTETVQTADAEVRADFELGNVSAGTHQLEALPYDDQGNPSVPMGMDVFIVPLEPWAEAANFAVSGEDAPFGVTYTGEAHLPQEPIKLPYLDLSSIPFVGGRWGVPPIQLDATLHATSMGGYGEKGDVDGDVALYLGGNTAEAKLDITGFTYTETFPDRLEFAEGEVEFNLAPYVIERQTGLVTLFPGAAEVFELKVIGPLLQAINSIASVTARITTSATGQGTLGVNNNNTDLTITKGEIEPHIDIQAIAEMNIFNLARSWFGGGGSGDFTIEIAPNPGIRDCTFSMAMEAGVVLQPFLDKNYKDNWELYSCPQTAQLVRKPYSALLPYTSAPLPPAQTSRPERLVNEQFTAEDFTETVLVEDAIWDASPVLAVGPEGHMALVWVTADAAGSLSTSAEIGVRLNDGTDWDTALNLTDNDTFDYSPTAAYDEKGNLVMAWLQHTGPQADELSEEFVQGFEIAYAVLDADSGEILESGSLTANEEMDFDPQLVADNQGGVWAFWQTSPGATLTGTPDSPNHLMASHWNGSKWADADLVTDELVGSLTLNVAADPDGGYAVIFDQDTDGDLETGQDREIALITGDKRSASSLHYLTENEVIDSAPLVAYAPDGNLAVAWYSAGEILGWWGDIETDTETFIAAADLPAVLVDGLLVAGSDKQLALLWEGTAGDTPDILLSQLDPESGTWSQPEALFANDLQEGSLSGGYDANGDLWVGVAKGTPNIHALELTDGSVIEIPSVPDQAELSVLQFADFITMSAGTSRSDGAGASGWLLGSGIAVVLLCGFVLVVGVLIVFLVVRSRKQKAGA